MTRFLALLVIAFLIWLALQRALARVRRTELGRQVSTLLQAWRRATQGVAGGSPPGRRAQSGGGGGQEVQLVRCSACGIYVPATTLAPGSGRRAPLCTACAAAARQARPS